MRLWLPALAEPNSTAAQVFTTSPMNVSTLGLMRDRASQRTMVLSNTPQPRPKALVQEPVHDRVDDPEEDDRDEDDVDDTGSDDGALEEEDFAAAGVEEGAGVAEMDIRLWPLLAPPRREW